MNLLRVVGDSKFAEVAAKFREGATVVVVPVLQKRAHVIYTNNTCVLEVLQKAQPGEVTDENILLANISTVYVIGMRIDALKDLIFVGFNKANEI